MPVLLHQLPDGDTIRQQWAELPPVLGATQMVGACAESRSSRKGAEKKEKTTQRRKLRGAASGLVVSHRDIPVFLTFPTNLIFCQKCGPVTHWSPFRFVESVAMPSPSEPKGARTMKSRATGFCSTRSRRSPPPAIL